MNSQEGVKVAQTAAITNANEFVDRRTFVKVYEERNLLEKSARYARTILSNWEDAQDAALIVYLRILTRFDSERGTIKIRKSVESYVMRSVINECCDLLRKKSSSNLSMESLVEDYVKWSSLPGTGTRPGSYSSLDTSIIVSEMLAGMPGLYRQPLYLSEVIGFSAKEAAEIMGITVPAYKSRLYRGRDFAKRYLASIRQPSC